MKLTNTSVHIETATTYFGSTAPRPVSGNIREIRDGIWIFKATGVAVVTLACQCGTDAYTLAANDTIIWDSRDTVMSSTGAGHAFILQEPAYGLIPSRRSSVNLGLSSALAGKSGGGGSLG